jgi:multidrug efflux pump
MFGLPGIFSFPFTPPSLGQDFLNTDIAVVLQTTGSWEELEGTVGQLMGKLVSNPMFVQPRPDLELNKPELRVILNRDKIANVGASVVEVGAAIETMLGGSKATRFKKNGEQYEVIVQLAKDKRRAPSDLTGIYVRGTGGQMVQLANLVTIEETVAPKELKHFDKLKAASITSTLAPGANEAAALTYIQNAVKEIGANTVTLEYAGTSREYMQAGGTIVFVFILALIFIYLVLAAQFESFVDPLVILVSVPLAGFGALLMLWVSGNSLNIFSQIGLITLVGLIAKNGILIVEFANQLQEQGKQKLEAVIEAASLRLRPILMTSAATIIGAVPLAMAHGAGAESRETIGLVIVGGMLIGTMFTLFVIPAVYVLIGQRKAPHAEMA